MGCHSCLQQIFLTQGINPGVPHVRQILYRLRHQGSPRPCESQVYSREEAGTGQSGPWWILIHIQAYRVTMAHPARHPDEILYQPAASKKPIQQLPPCLRTWPHIVRSLEVGDPCRCSSSKMLPETPSLSAPSCLVCKLPDSDLPPSGFKMQAAYPECICSPAGQEKGKGREEKGKKEREGRSASCVWLAELSQKSCSYISLVRTVSHGHLYFPRSHTHTSPYISLVRAMSRGHTNFPSSLLLTSTHILLVRTVSHGHRFQERFWSTSVLLDTFPLLQIQSSFLKN